MKKFFVMLIVVLLLFPIRMSAVSYNSLGLEDVLIDEGINYELYNYSQGKGKVNVYLFRGKGCSHCRDFLGYVRDNLLPQDGYKFNLITYEIWNDANNLKLLKKVFDYMDVPENTGIPFIVIGDKYFVGYSETVGNNVKEAIESLYKSEDNTDVVQGVIDEKTKKSDSKSVSSTGEIVTIILCTVVLGALYIFKSNYDRELLVKKIENIKIK